MNTTIPPARKLVPDYRAELPHLRQFYAFSPTQEGLKAAIQHRLANQPNRQVLADRLKQQYSQMIPGQPYPPQIDQLLSPNTFVITTGQQPALGGGPLYNWYKALGAIALARQCREWFPGYRFVPVFWIAGEDHDREELNHTRYGWQLPETIYPALSDGPVGRQIITEVITPVLPFMGPDARFYQPGSSWARAFACQLHHYLGQHGMLVLDADCPELKRLFLPAMLDELERHPAEGLIQQTSAELEALGYKTQLHPRPINLFYLTDDSRDRIEYVWAQKKWVAGNKSWDSTQLKQELHSHPELFSPNAALRPLYQETILPGIAYVGGAGELAYWLQLKRVFAYHRVPYPVLVQRPGGLLISEAQRKQLEELGLTSEIFAMTDAQLRAHTARRGYSQSEWEAQQQQLLAQWQQMTGWLEAIDPSLGKSANGHQRKVERYLSQMERRLVKVTLNRNPRLYHEPLRLKNQVQPEGHVQERVLNHRGLGLHTDWAAVLQQLLPLTNPLAPSAQNQLWVTDLPAT